VAIGKNQYTKTFEKLPKLGLNREGSKGNMGMGDTSECEKERQRCT
jgi:hypothetical protein